MNREAAEKINKLMLEYNSSLNEAVGVIREECTANEAESYIKPIAHIMALTFDILDMLHNEHPDLKPASFN